VKKLLSGMSPWTPMFAFICMFHIVRGVPSDALLFGIFTLIEIASWKGWLPTFSDAPKLNPWIVRGVLVAAGAVLFFSERNGILDVFLLLALAPIALGAVNFKSETIKPSRLVIRTRWIWLTLTLAMAMVELVAYIVANILKDDKNWPTVSVLVGPVLDAPLGRAIFMVIWVGAGWGMFRALASLRSATAGDR
jgi:hypothetical protein